MPPKNYNDKKVEPSAAVKKKLAKLPTETVKLKDDKEKNKTVRFKGGGLRVSLGLNPDDPLPKNIMNKITRMKAGDMLTFTYDGKEKTVKVTDRMIKQAQLGLNLSKRMEKYGQDARGKNPMVSKADKD
jgi:hypothetical protein